MKQIVFAVFVAVTQVFAITDVGGTIATNTVWGPTGNPPDSIYNIVSQVFVSPGITLTIQPGVRIQSSSYGFTIEGCIIANGTANDSVRFTSSQTTPNPGDWGGFFYFGTPSDSSVFRYSIIEYATYGFDGGSLIDIRNSTIGKCISGTVLITNSVISDCEISNNTYGGIGIGDIYEDSMDCVVGGNLITNNGVGIYYGNRATLPEMSAPNYFVNNDTGIVIAAWSNLEVNQPQEWNPAAGGIDCVLYADITVTPSGRLTIMPGNVFKFYGGTLHVGGQIVATGTPYDSITFTSAHPMPNQGDWFGIWFDAYCPDTSIFEYCIIEYGSEFRHLHGTPLRIENCAIRFQMSGIATESNATVRTCEISDNVGGIACAGYWQSPGIDISDNNIHNNHEGIRNFGPYLPTFSLPNQFAMNEYDIVLDDMNIRDEVIWNPAMDSVECFVNYTLTIDTSGTFIIAPGNRFRVCTAVFVHGRLIARGTETMKITFTSQAPIPTPGSWGGIVVFPSSDSCIFSNCIIEAAYFGIDCQGRFRMDSCLVTECNFGISAANADFTINACLISNNTSAGICIGGADSLLISNNTITSNRIGINCDYGALPIITLNEIYDNIEYGVFNTNNYWIYAENNWWGDSTGPCDTSDIDTLYNPSGLGDRVSDHVDYDPWIGFIGCEEYPTIAPAIGGSTFYIPRPNPFLKTTTLSFNIADEQNVKCVIYNALGQGVRDLCDERRNAGQHQVFWDGRDNKGKVLPAGVYWCSFETPSTVAIKKIIKLE